MGYAKVPAHRPPLGVKPSRTTTQRLSLSHTPFISSIILCLVLLLLPFLVGAGPLLDTPNVLDGPINLGISSINTTWEAGGYADITLRVPLHWGSDTFTSDYLLPDGIDIVLIPYRPKPNITIAADLSLTLISRERVGGAGILRYIWPIPVCMRPGRHELQLRTRSSATLQPPAVPVFVVVSDDRFRMSCDADLQIHFHVPRRRYRNHQGHQTPQQALITEADEKAATSAAAQDDILANASLIHVGTERESVRKRSEDHGHDENYDEPGDAHLYSSTGPSYNVSSSTYSASYTASENHSATATSLTTPGASTSVRNGTSSASGNGTSTIVVTSTATATATSVRTVTSVSTDIETMVTTVTGSDSTEIFTTTQTLISTMMIVVPTTATGGLLPVNAATGVAMPPLTVAAIVCVTTVLWLLCSANRGIV